MTAKVLFTLINLKAINFVFFVHDIESSYRCDVSGMGFGITFETSEIIEVSNHVT